MAGNIPVINQYFKYDPDNVTHDEDGYYIPNAELLQDTKQFKKGDIFALVRVDFDGGNVQFYKEVIHANLKMEIV